MKPVKVIAPKAGTIAGFVTRIQSGFHTVHTGQGSTVCHLRGRLKRTSFRGDILAVGDQVRISLLNDGTGMIEEIAPRIRSLVRLDPTPKGDYQQVLLANVDQILLVFACANPEPHLRMLDRFLVICEKQEIPVRVVANKVDLVGEQKAHDLFDLYPPLGYPVIYTSAAQKIGIEELREALSGKISGLAGPSGVGKSSLLNAVQPALGLAVRDISQATAKGRHTTVVREMFPLVEGGFVTDLPGLRSLSLWDTQPEELDGYFPELRDLVRYCQFNDCTHQNEPGCAVRAAVEQGQVHPERYISYLRLRNGE
jgi:ribosome biogenesis GTPase